ncbi:MAG TPA: hypothetical protein DEA08_37220 [Planctomycetes bacterium]|nr:hypothetical protein [Planctomycetota bacterium]
MSLDAPAQPKGPLLPLPLRVEAVRQETKDTWTLTLERPAGYSFAPGQFDMLYAFGIGEVPISHSGDPADASLIHTIRAVGAVTRALCALQPGDTLGLRGPFGRPWPLEQARGRHALFVGGGIGLAPLRPAILAALADPVAYPRVTVLSGSRTPADRLYPAELASWGEGRGEVHETVDAASEEWRGNVGVVTTLLPFVDLSGPTTAFLCGPEIMMRFTANALIGRGVAPEDVFVSMERNMQCAVATCGHCQLAGSFVCKDGPVYGYPEVDRLMLVREL